jgi:hypothetical protein
MTRYLIPAFIESAIHRGKSVAQFLSGFMVGNEPALRYVELRPGEDGVEVWVHEVFDDGSEMYADVGEFGAVDGRRGDKPAAVAETIAGALVIAHEQFGASPDRWVNEGMIGDEYLNYLRGKQTPPSSAAEDGLASFIHVLQDRWSLK